MFKHTPFALYLKNELVSI